MLARGGMLSKQEHTTVGETFSNFARVTIRFGHNDPEQVAIPAMGIQVTP